MSINKPIKTGVSRRDLLAGATAAGIAAIVSACGGSGSGSAPQSSGSPTTALKLMVSCRKRADLTNEQFYDYWLNQHAPYAAEQLRRLGAFRYVQSHTDYSQLTTELRVSRGQLNTAEEGLTEVWFPSAQALMNKLNTTEGLLAFNNLAADEANFLDLPACSHFYTVEVPMIVG